MSQDERRLFPSPEDEEHLARKLSRDHRAAASCPNLSAHLRESPVDALTQMSNAPRMGKPDTQIGALGEETLERSSRGG